MGKPRLTGQILRHIEGEHFTFTQKKVIAICRWQDCGKKFECIMTTKVLRYCPECRPIAAKVKKDKDAERTKRNRASGKYAQSGKRRKLIPYAGYDKGEHTL